MAKDKGDKPASEEQEPKSEPPPVLQFPGRGQRRRTVRAWADELKARRAIAAGAGALAGWTPETELTEAEFTTGLEAYQQRPLGGLEQPPKDKLIHLRPEGDR